MKTPELLLSALFCCAAALPAAAQDQAARPDGNGQKAAPAAAPQSPEQAELTKLSTENQLTDQRLKKKLSQLNSEKEEMKAQYELELQKQKGRTAAMEAELAAAATENKLADERNRKALADLAAKIARTRAENDLKAEQQRLDAIDSAKEKNDLDMAMKRMDLAERKMKLEKAELDNRMSKLNSDLDLRGKKAEWKKETNTDPVYTDKPFANGKIVISDRRIPLNGPIIPGVATYVSDRINYFNNISTQPLFIVIDYSPGGSSDEGYAILKAMESSRAPVYVVVKSMAASMAAIITTLADKSYIYPSAKVLHHQPWGFSIGNTTQQKENLELGREIERRIMAPVAKKMGLTMEEFRKKMYEHNSDGDWLAFGDDAVSNKWVTGTVDRVEETGVFKNPDEEQKPRNMKGMAGFELEEKTDEKGNTYVQLPHLKPFDFYFMYNPDKYYRE
jgi:ATP-dependent Clp protease protease subunit